MTGRNLVALDPAGVDAVLVQGTVASLTQGDTDTFAAADNLGTPRDDVDSTGTLINHRVFSAFGQDVYDSNSAVVNWAGFGGGHVDSNTGLVNSYHRWYDPASGKWLSEDPAGFAAGDANLMRYVGNNPTSAVDPLGLAAQTGPGSGYQGLITIADVQAGYASEQQYQAQAKAINEELAQAIAARAQLDKAAHKAAQEKQKEQNKILELEVKNEQAGGAAEMKLEVIKLGNIYLIIQNKIDLQMLRDAREMREYQRLMLKYEFTYGPNGPR